MGIYTTFFAAKPSELPKMFPGWSKPRKVKRTLTNPFTKETMKVEVLEPSAGIPGGKVDVPKKCPQFTHKFLLPQELRLVAADLAPALSSKKKKLAFEPILVASGDQALHEVPSELVAGLAQLDDRRVAPVAKTWSKAMKDNEVPYALSAADAGAALRELRRVAAAALARGGGVHAWVR